MNKMQGNFITRLIFILVVQLLISYACGYVFGNNYLAALIVSDLLTALFFAYISLPPQYRKGFYKQEAFHKMAITYFLIFVVIGLLFNGALI